ncbi:hypothetical protein GCM10007275_18690 [Jeotgalicoccus coquinae]|uniref:Acetyltransferase (GNAT) family protein n=1 Tax=Jeotgalicoccus coquinae TaxID=709509 RepID=A0A6V7RR28_9STAP|nr:GNAT family N-acetyltransferase [Jeotgalicoccus coquinae]MBB6423930.1 RimJ/RimL family protein N-acetyltransferase [Jeotgalicoccus coquinae]GGE23860.1 hypothetical protein GCM10007275_18690 [Jeotgalicoccus coquinae]CAD2080401.1 Acetyltransferase (GNAT) family protein [Jeotgalicoccus coquinae]
MIEFVEINEKNYEAVVGFVLLDEDEEEKELMIWRMMVDKDYQGKGYGRAIVEKVMKQFEADSRFDVLIADYVKGNDVMGKLLESLGFEYGEFDEENNEYVMKFITRSNI